MPPSPKSDQELWDSLKTNHQSFGLMMAQRTPKMDASRRRWVMNQLSVQARGINAISLELAERACGSEPKPITP